jgi:hypothetical protein
MRSCRCFTVWLPVENAVQHAGGAGHDHAAAEATRGFEMLEIGLADAGGMFGENGHLPHL